jgi:hypothetical protein
MIPLAFGVAIFDALTRHTRLQTIGLSLLFAALGTAGSRCIIFKIIHHPKGENPQRMYYISWFKQQRGLVPHKHPQPKNNMANNNTDPASMNATRSSSKTAPPTGFLFARSVGDGQLMSNDSAAVNNIILGPDLNATKLYRHITLRNGLKCVLFVI